MANNMKTKFTGLFRNLFGRSEPTSPLKPEPVSIAAASPAPTPTPVVPPAARFPQAAPGPASHYPTTYTAPLAPQVNDGEHLEIPLIAIINALPMDLKAKMMQAPVAGQTVPLHVEAVIAQLAFGAVKITYGELRRLAPGTFVNGDSVYDSRPVSVPLNEILMRINPALLARRPAAQKIAVAEEISGPFGGHGRGVAFTANPIKAPAPSAAPASRAYTPAPPTPPTREYKPVTPVSFTPPASPVTPPPAPAPAPPSPLLPPSEPIAFNLRSTTPMVAPNSFAEPSKPTSNGSYSNGSNGNSSPTLPPFKFTAAPVPPSPTFEPPMAAQPTLAISLRDLAENWPDEIKREIVQNGLTNASLPLPMALVEPGMKRGRVTMTWRELRSLIQPQSSVSLSDDLGLELPLKVLAPAFLIAQKSLAPLRSKVAVSAEIPNLFFGFPQPEPVAPVAFTPAPLPLSLAPQEPVSTSAATIRTLAAPTTPKPSDTNLFAFNADGSAASGESSLFRRTPAPKTDFATRQAQPKDVIASALALPGVAGAVVALADGLRVAGVVPVDVNADAVSAFLPQIFERISQSTRELRMGALNNVSFTVGNVPWKIFRVNSVYFAAFGRAGEALPKAQLAALAAGLDHKQK